MGERRTRRRRTRAALVGLAVGGLALAGCGLEAAPATKAGAGAPTVTLRLGTADFPGRPSADQIEHFADRVAELSGQQVRIEPQWQAQGDQLEDDWDQNVARMAVDGRLEMALIPSRAWDTEGVTSMHALNAPMLVTSDQLVTGIVTGDLGDRMLAGLDSTEVEGLALIPEGIRRVLSYGEPLTSVADFADQLVRVPASTTTYATFTALGARPDDASAGKAAALQGEVAGAESSFLLASTMPVQPTAAVGNLPLWPKVNSLVINRAALAGLSAQHRDILRESATQTRDWAITEQPTDLEAARAYCDEGNRIVSASRTQVEDFQKVTASVTEGLKEDTTTRELIDAIEELARRTGHAPADLPPCDGPAAPPGSPSPTGVPGTLTSTGFPNGTYRAAIPASVLLARGIPAMEAGDHAGVWTLRFDKGSLFISDVNYGTGRTQTDQGVYCATADTISVGIEQFGTPPTCANFWTGRWQLGGDELRFTDVADVTPSGAGQLVVPALFGTVPFVRIA